MEYAQQHVEESFLNKVGDWFYLIACAVAVGICVVGLVVPLLLLIVPLMFLVWPSRSWHFWRSLLSQWQEERRAKRLKQYEQAAFQFMAGAVHMGATTRTSIESTAALLKLAGFRAVPFQGNKRINPFCVFKSLEYKGRDATEAQAWMQKLYETMPRGDIHRECEHIAQAILHRRQSRTTHPNPAPT